MAEKKVGRLSESDKSFIKANARRMTPGELAESLGRTEPTIKSFLEDNAIPHYSLTDEENAREALRARLYRRTYWKEIKRQYVGEELSYFEEMWIDLLQQFKENVLPAEEIQIKNYIMTDILVSRCMRESANIIKEIEDLQEEVRDLRKQARDADEDSDEINDRILRIQELVSNLRNASNAYNKERNDLLQRQKDISKDLKATRAERLKKVDDSKSTFRGYIELMDDIETRRKEGEGVELLRIAKERERGRLGEHHTYCDGEVARPFLTPEVVLLDKEEEFEIGEGDES